MLTIRVKTAKTEIEYSDAFTEPGPAHENTDQYACERKKGDQLLLLISHICAEVKRLESK
jgi:hypothetical protein